MFTEHRVTTNGLSIKPERKKTASKSGKTHKGNGRDTLLNALAIRGLAHLDVDTKDEMRNLILTETNPSPEQRAAIIQYCSSDVAGAAFP